MIARDPSPGGEKIASLFGCSKGFSLERLIVKPETTGFDINSSVHLIFDQDQNLVALIELWDEANPPVHPYIWMSVDPDLEDQGLEEYLLGWAEEQALQVFERVAPRVCGSLCVPIVTMRSNRPGKPIWPQG